MIGLILLASLVGAAAPLAEPTVVATCYLQDQKADPQDSDKLIQFGPQRLVVIAFSKSLPDAEAVAKVRLYDPTNIFEGKKIGVVNRKDDGGFDVALAGPGVPYNRILSVKGGPEAKPLIAYLLRAEHGAIVSTMGGGCFYVVTTDPDAEWQEKIKFRSSIDQ
ncbi:hypothetical protein [Sphingomonas sp.]|uniref:hypothetical protein n=1 Tax=Sphingomonas sp. TaxID=28214 RepID=UPI001B21E69F|nr:hypothetical protein [Sphingomonas sp.]MBO9712081.1 hypothetical protein [Sphingomonas sp.]